MLRPPRDNSDPTDLRKCAMTDAQIAALGPTHPIDKHKRLVTAWHALDVSAQKLAKSTTVRTSNTCRAANGVGQILEAQGYFLEQDSKWQKRDRPETPAERQLREFNSAQ